MYSPLATSDRLGTYITLLDFRVSCTGKGSYTFAEEVRLQIEASSAKEEAIEMLGTRDEDRNDHSFLTTPFLKEFKSTQSVDFVAKILIVGNSCSGKSCLFRRFSDDLFNENYRKTNSVEFRHRYLHTRDCKAKIQVWDCISTASHIMSSIYKGADAAIVAIDTTNSQALRSIEEWMEEISKSSPQQVKIYLVGTKSDLTESRAITEEQIRGLAEEMRIGYIEVSSKNGHNVDNLFYRIVSDLQPIKAQTATIGRKSLNGGIDESMDIATKEPLNSKNGSVDTTDGRNEEQTIAKSLQLLAQDCNCLVM